MIRGRETDLRDTPAFVRDAEKCDRPVRVRRENPESGTAEFVNYFAAEAAALRVAGLVPAKQYRAGAAGGSQTPKSDATAEKKPRMRKPRTELTQKQQAVWEWVHQQKLSYKDAALAYKDVFGKQVSWQNIQKLYEAANDVMERRRGSVNTRRELRDDD